MDKKKMITASLASVAILGAGFVSQNHVVSAEETATNTVVNDDKAGLEKALTEVENAKIAKINEDKTLSEADKAKAIEDAKAEVGKDDVLKAIDLGELSLDDVLNELPKEDGKIEKVEKTKELSKEDTEKIVKAESEHKAEEAAKSESDKIQDKVDDLSDKISKLEKRATEFTNAIGDKTTELKAAKDEVSRLNDLLNGADSNADENWTSDLEAEKEAAEAKVSALNEELSSLVSEAEPVVNYLNGLTDDYNKALKDLETAKAKDEDVTDKAIEVLQNKVADLEKEVAELENQLNGTSSDVEDYYVNGLREKLDAKKAELEKAQAELDKALDAITPETGDALVQPEAPETLVEPARPEFGAHNAELKKVLNEIEKVRADIEKAGKDGADKATINGLYAHLKDLIEAFDILTNNKPAVNEVPEFTGGVNGGAVNEPAVVERPALDDSLVPPVNNVPDFQGGVNGAEPAINDVPAFDVTTLTQQQQKPTYAAPAANDDKQDVKQVGKLTELPNTGEASGTALTSMGIGALLLGLVPFVKRKEN